MNKTKFILPFLVLGMVSCESITEKIAESATETLMETALGDSVDVEFTKTENGEVGLTINSPEGTTTLDVSKKDLPEDFPKDIYINKSGKRGPLTLVDSPDGKFISFIDTLSMSLLDAQNDIKNNMSNYKLKFETSSDINANLMFESESVKTITISLNEYEGVILANYAVMY